MKGKYKALKSYINGIKRCERKFVTTSFLDSDFWHEDKLDVIHENIKLQERILNSDNQDKGLFRLFIVPETIPSYISKQVDFALSQEKIGNIEPLKRIREINDNLASLADKINMKIVEQDKIPNKFKKIFNPFENIEIALYDDFRIDQFNLNNKKQIETTEIHTKYGNTFYTRKILFNEYFSLVWELASAISVEEYINRVNEEISEQKTEKIDYESNWLLKYDAYVTTKNRILDSEMGSVTSYLETYCNGKTFENYLDIGAVSYTHLTLPTTPYV